MKSRTQLHTLWRVTVNLRDNPVGVVVVDPEGTIYKSDGKRWREQVEVCPYCEYDCYECYDSHCVCSDCEEHFQEDELKLVDLAEWEAGL
jgi:hypothetical protein